MTRVLAVDGNSLAHRAWHAIRETDDAVGPFVTGGFVSMLGTAWQHGPFDGVVLAFDDRVNQRKLDFPEYKANRVQDDELRGHLDDLQDHLREAGFPVWVESGAEADDLVAAVADACRTRDWACRILSSDRDLTALVSDEVHLLRPRGSMSDVKVYDTDAVVDEYGVAPWQYTDFAALRGDPSDGLVGVNGIGPKMAARLLVEHEDLVGIYANLSLLSPKVEAALRAGREVVERNRLLMSPLPHLRADVDGVVATGLDLQRIDRVLTELGLGFAAGRFRFAVERPPAPPTPPPPTDADAPVDEVFVPASVLARRAESDTVERGEQAALF